MNSDEGDKIRKKLSYGYRANESSEDAFQLLSSNRPLAAREKSTACADS